MKLFSTSCETLFLGWDGPLLPQSVDLLRDRFAQKGKWNLASLLCVLPAQRAAERLAELLEWSAEEHDLQYTPPTIITVGQLPEFLYKPRRPLALEFEQTLAWVQVLRACSATKLSPLVSNVPRLELITPWMELAGTLRRLQEQLAAAGLSFRDVAEVSETDAEKRRWKLLSKLYDDYLGVMQSAGLADPHWSRREAIESGRCRSDQTVVMIGTIDLSSAVVNMLRALETDLIALVAAPPSQAFQFDEFGCLDTAAWLQHEVPVQDHQLIAAGDISDQSSAVAETIADYGQRFSADQITIGVTDESHVAPVEVELSGCGVDTFRHLGWTVSETSVGRLLQTTASFLQRRTWSSLAALVRHADVHRAIDAHLRSLPDDQAIGETVDWLAEIDSLLANHYPIRVTTPLAKAAFQAHPVAKQVADLVQTWLDPFIGNEKTIAGWCEQLDKWLSKVFQSRVQPESEPVDVLQHDRVALALSAVRRRFERFSSLNDSLDFHMSGGAAIELLSGRLADVRLVPPATPQQIEILGWLDLALDDAPAMVVLGLNHPFVPAATTSDPFLPGALRSKLRVGDNERRYARDVYAMQLMLSTRSATRFIVGKSAADRSPTPPSRLLAAAPKADVARRMRNLLDGTRDRVIVHHRWDVGSTTNLPVPNLPKVNGDDQPYVIESLSVTAFRDYLACPYRFFLRHVLKLKPIDDSASELAANQFGDLVHASLERFGLSDDRDESNPDKIKDLLDEHLKAYADEMYGDSASTAVAIQVEQAQRRLDVVAHQQALRYADGWRIHATEASVGKKENAGVKVDDVFMGLKGRFDRIDKHIDGRWAILDYKTHGHKPEKKHLRKTDDGDQWIDLQLPLYRMMIPFLGIDADPESVELGYFNVAEKAEDTRINIAGFTPPQMQQAETLIHDCIRGIRRGDFEPTNDRVQFDDYGMILQTGVASRLMDLADLVIEEPVV